jgi:hypothetical protein
MRGQGRASVHHGAAGEGTRRDAQGRAATGSKGAWRTARGREATESGREGERARGRTADRGSRGRTAVRGRTARGARQGGDREEGRVVHGAGREGGGAWEGARGREVSGIRARGEGEKKGLTGAREGCWSCAVFANGARAGGGGRDARAPGGVGARCGVRDARARRGGGAGRSAGREGAGRRAGARREGVGREGVGRVAMCRSRNAGLGSDCRTTAVMRVRSGGPPNAMLGSDERRATDFAEQSSDHELQATGVGE